MANEYPAGVEITGEVSPEYAAILTPEALAFVAKLQRTFGARRAELLQQRQERQRALDARRMFDFLPETAAVRAGHWSIAPTPADLHDRRVQITGPTAP